MVRYDLKSRRADFDGFSVQLEQIRIYQFQYSIVSLFLNMAHLELNLYTIG